MTRNYRKRVKPGLVVVKEYIETGPMTKKYAQFEVVAVYPTGFSVRPTNSDRAPEHIDWDRKDNWRILAKNNVLRRLFY